MLECLQRMNRLSCQESENEVAIAKLKGQVEQERATSDVLAIQHQHALSSAQAEGKAEAEKCLAFLSMIQSSDVGSALTSHRKDLAVELWYALRRGEDIQRVSQGSAHVYFTPQVKTLLTPHYPLPCNYTYVTSLIPLPSS